ncbi:MAG: glutamine synthetase, partial [Firmicutes bacterium]|nr:glutamine synthetase [Bacillota bacterium]
HTHQSIWKGGKPLFAGDQYAGMSQMGLHYIGGILKHAKVLAAFTNPTVNSYKRLVPHFEAPCFISWSDANRSTMIRIPAQRGKATRIEIRSVDPSANPYLAMSGLLAAGLDGIKDKLDGISPIKKNLFRMSDAERKRLGIKNLPESLQEAMHNFAGSALMRETIGEVLFTKLLEAKQIEWDDYRTSISAWELNKYLPII